MEYIKIEQAAKNWGLSMRRAQDLCKLGRTGASGSDGADGVGISKIEKTAADGNVDTYTIALTNGNTDTFTVTNGTNGLTPFIGENGNRWIGETDTGVKAAGTDGKDGVDGTNGTDGKVGEGGSNGLEITSVGIGGVALASNIALIAYALIKKKNVF